MDKNTRQLAEFASAFRFSMMTHRHVQAAKERLIDTLGCALAGYESRTATMARRIASVAGADGATGVVLFTNASAALDSAAFANSCMIRALDFNDRYPGGHPSDCLGATLAHALASGTSGADFLTAMAVTYEVFARLSDAAMLSRRGWDQGFVVGLSTVCGLGSLLKLDFDALSSAIGMFASTGVPLRVTRAGELTEWKNVATPYVVRNACVITQLAGMGMRGPTDPFEGRNGLFENITGPFAIAAFPTEGGSEMTSSVQLKYWPVETNGQPVVWAALEMKEKLGADEVQSFEVRTNKFTLYEIGSEPQKWDPRTRETADHSLPYIFARSFAHGPLDEKAFELEAVQDPALRPLMNKIRVVVDPEIDALTGGQTRMRVDAVKQNGETISVTVGNPLGHPDNPLAPSDVANKFERLAEPLIGKAAAQAALEKLWALEAMADVSRLSESLHVRRA